MLKEIFNVFVFKVVKTEFFLVGMQKLLGILICIKDLCVFGFYWVSISVGLGTRNIYIFKIILVKKNFTQNVFYPKIIFPNCILSKSIKLYVVLHNKARVVFDFRSIAKCREAK